MIAPEIREGINRQTARARLLWRNLALSALIFLCLELWRPCFFLTDDNLDGGLGFFTEMGIHLAHGQSPFVTDHLFGGGYNLLRDPTFFAWHPLYLLCSLLAVTPLHFWIIDADAFGLFLLTAAGFTCLAVYLRTDLRLKLSDGWITFYTLSFTYSMMALATGASWLYFICSHSALPWLALGVLHRNAKTSFALVGIASLHELIGGHLSVTVSTTLFFSLFVLGLCWSRRSWQPCFCWLLGLAAALIVASPLILPMLHGFLSSGRSSGVGETDMTANMFHVSLFPTSVFIGMAVWMIHRPEVPIATYILATGASAAAWCVLPAFLSRAKWRALDLLCVALMGLIAFFICRPLWMAHLMTHVPVLRAMRWPFRDFLQFQFFLHLFLVGRRTTLRPGLRVAVAAFGTAMLIVPMIFYVPPTLNPMLIDRKLIFSGETDRYWDRVRPLLKPGDRVAVVIPLKLYLDRRFDIPYSLLGTFNYAEVEGFTNASGYSLTTPANQYYVHGIVSYPFGAFIPEEREALWHEHPELKIISLESLTPLKITLNSRTKPVVDLTPFVPEEIRAGK